MANAEPSGSALTVLASAARSSRWVAAVRLARAAATVVEEEPAGMPRHECHVVLLVEVVLVAEALKTRLRTVTTLMQYQRWYMKPGMSIKYGWTDTAYWWARLRVDYVVL